MAVNKEMIYHNLSVLLGAGVPVRKALVTVTTGLRGPMIRDLRRINEALARGASLAEAISARPGRFPPMDLMTVRAGETSGTIAESLQRLAEWYAFRRRLKRIVITGLLYPLMVLHVAAFLLPLPGLVTGECTVMQYLLAVAKSLAPLYLLVALLWTVRRFAPPTGWVRRVLDAIGLTIPLLGKGLLHLALARFARVFHTLYKAGVPITQALPQATATCGNAVVAFWLEGATHSVRQGHPAWEGFGPRLPLDFTATWANGEQAGALDEALGHLARREADVAESRLLEVARWTPRLIYLLILLWTAAIVLSSAQGLLVRELPTF